MITSFEEEQLLQEQVFTTLLSVPEVFLDKKYIVNHFFNNIDLNKIHEFLKLNGWKENYSLENRLFKAYDRNQEQVIVSNDMAIDHKTVTVELILNLSVIHKISILELLKQFKKVE